MKDDSHRHTAGRTAGAARVDVFLTPPIGRRMLAGCIDFAESK